jgi:transposase
MDRRSLVNAIFYVIRAGCAWRLLPTDFGPWQIVYGCYRRWCQDHTWKFVHDTLRDYLRKTHVANGCRRRLWRVMTDRPFASTDALRRLTVGILLRPIKPSSI